MKLLPEVTHTWKCMSVIEQMKFYTDMYNMAWKMMAKKLGWTWYHHKLYDGTITKRSL